MVEIIKGWAAEPRIDFYSTLSSELRGVGFSVPPRGRLMSRLLKAACEVEADRGVSVMLTAIVVNKRTKQPSAEFEVLAKSDRFRRGDVPNWTWKTERDGVFNQYRR
ncbi:hypothetical protein AB0O22_32050 [Streptomyces sp. NPDC091204]|uniref:hypothetical protein n=1 Tax=Streptomyces sp. NPDC091204 TaxID=3155299 RepID=UPI00343B8D4B